MGKPAARIGDMTAHGGTIVVGCPTVLIGGMPAARMMDMHVCPMVTPAPAPIPHVGGPIILGSMGVLIGGMPAARMGDMAICVGPPDVIALGCMTVMIGEMMPGAAGAPGPPMVGLTSAAAAQMGAATALSDNKETSTKEEHWVEFEFVDKAGKPVSGVHYKFTDAENKESNGVLKPDGRIRRDALKQGQCEGRLLSVHSAKWSKNSPEVGEKVKLIAETLGFDSGSKGFFRIYRRDINQPDVLHDTIETQVQGDKIEADWEYIAPQGAPAGKDPKAPADFYSAPEFYFVAAVNPCESRSALLSYRDWIEFTFKDEQGNPLANKKFRLYLASGEIRQGKLDASGHAKIKDIPPGKVRIFLDPRK